MAAMHSTGCDRVTSGRWLAAVPQSSKRATCHNLGVIVSERAARLVDELQAASDALIGLARGISAEGWVRVASSGEWSPGKDAEHVADGNALHQWVVRSTLGPRAGKRPTIERAQLTSQLGQREVIDVLKQRVQESSSLIQPLTDEQLALPCRTGTLAQFIERGLIGHYRTHHEEIEQKLRRASAVR
jgi:DinB superfamily